MTSYWPTIGHLKCILACHCNLVCLSTYHWAFVLYVVIFLQIFFTNLGHNHLLKHPLCESFLHLKEHFYSNYYQLVTALLASRKSVRKIGK